MTTNLNHLRLAKSSVMQNPFARIILLLLYPTILLTSCIPASPPSPTALPIPLVFTTSEQTATIEPSETPLAEQVSFEPAIYRDETEGFELDYPSP
ncbi:MAG: hypothetical protein E3J30_06130 [Anaerolineales bacterium]|nr:MAG: hypothetical protein E3J30_06130 [Anaerolineales bacterium]